MDSDLTTPAVLAGELGVNVGDVRLPRLVSAASEACRRFLRRRQVHYAATITEKVRSRGTQRLLLDVTPIGTVTSVTLVDGTTVDPAEYATEDADAGLLFRRGGWPYTGIVRQGLLYVDPLPGSEESNITVVYSGGWVTPAQALATGSSLTRSLPFDIEEACVETAVALYLRGGTDQGIASESLGDYSATYRAPKDVPSAMPPTAEALLAPYMRPLG